MAYWLMKTEPDVFSIEDLAGRLGQTEPWDGVRNYQARNMMRDQMQPGDMVFFYHSNCALPGIVGLAEIICRGYPDSSAWDAQSPYFDAASPPEKPRWFRVDVRFVSRFERTLSLALLREQPLLAGMQLLRKGNRLSVMPVSDDEAAVMLGML